jgi:hypothetical protein
MAAAGTVEDQKLMAESKNLGLKRGPSSKPPLNREE